MRRELTRFMAAGTVLALGLSIGASVAEAQKSGGILKFYHRGTPPSGSIHEEATNSTVSPYMGVFNNLVMYDHSKPTNSVDTIVPDLATEWAWNGDGTKLTFKIREGVKFHDGKPMTAKDVVCTWKLVLGKAKARLRKNPRKSWYGNLASVEQNGDYEVTFNLKRKQPAFLALVVALLFPRFSLAQRVRVDLKLFRGSDARRQ